MKRWIKEAVGEEYEWAGGGIRVGILCLPSVFWGRGWITRLIMAVWLLSISLSLFLLSALL